METTSTRKTTIETITPLYDWHTRLFNNALLDITDEDAQNRLNSKANHVAWLAGSLVQERFELAKVFDIKMTQTSHDLFKDHKGIQDDIKYPSLKEFIKDWESVSPLLREALVNATEEKLDSPDPWEMPGGDYKLSDVLVFCVDRESYCIGQIGLYRRLLGYDAMKYD